MSDLHNPLVRLEVAEKRIEKLEEENERLTAVYETAKDHVEWCRLNRGRGYSRLEKALTAVEEKSDE